MLLAARALTFLADVLPSSCSSIVRHGAVPAFCARLLTIEYIDLAEQSLQVRPRAGKRTDCDIDHNASFGAQCGPKTSGDVRSSVPARKLTWKGR